MKHWNLLIWVPQFGISVVFPLILFIMLAVWLQERWGWGSWVIVAGIFCGLITAGSLKACARNGCIPVHSAGIEPADSILHRPNPDYSPGEQKRMGEKHCGAGIGDFAGQH